MALADCDPPADNFAAVDPTWDIPNVVFSATSKTQTQADGAVIAVPALRADWDAATNIYVTGVMFKYEPTSFSGSPKTSDIEAVSTLAGGDWETTDGIVSEATYDCWYRGYGPTGKTGDWIGPVSVTMNSISLVNVRDFLNMIKPNLQRRDFYVPMNGAALVAPFKTPGQPTAFGEQFEAITIPAGVNDVVIERDAGTGNHYGLATVGDNGGSYSHSMLAKVSTGTATLRMRFVDRTTLVPIVGGYGRPDIGVTTGNLDVSFSLTTTATTFTFPVLYSDDADFAECLLQIYTETGDVTGGQVVTVTEFMLQTDDYFDPHGMWTPWRPSIDEDHLERYGPYIYTLYRAALAADPNFTMRSNSEGNGQQLRPPGLTRIRPVSGTSYVFDPVDIGGGRRFINASPSTCEIPAKSSVFFNAPGIITIIAEECDVTMTLETGVVLKPPYGCTLPMVIPMGGSAQFGMQESRDAPEGTWRAWGDFQT